MQFTITEDSIDLVYFGMSLKPIVKTVSENSMTIDVEGQMDLELRLVNGKLEVYYEGDLMTTCNRE